MSATANASSSSDELDSGVFAGRVLPGHRLALNKLKILDVQASEASQSAASKKKFELL